MKKPLPKPKKHGAISKEEEAKKKDKAADADEEGDKMYKEQDEPEGNGDKDLLDEGYFAKGGYIANPTEAQARSGYCVGAGCKGCGSSNCMAQGGIAEKENRLTGSKNARKYSEQREQKGIHTPRMPYPRDKSSYGESSAGYSSKGSLNEQAKGQHKEVLHEMKSMKKPNLYAEGGEVDIDGDSEADEELMDAIGSELMEAFEKKDKQGILDAIRAIAMSCKE